MRLLRNLFLMGNLLAVTLLPLVSQAADTSFGLNEAVEQVPVLKSVAGKQTVEGVVGVVISVVLSFLGIVFFLLIFYAGLSWMTARGNSEQVDKAKEIIEGAGIGLILVLAAYAIANLVFTTLANGV